MSKKLLCLCLSVLLMLPLQHSIASKGTLVTVDTATSAPSQPSDETVKNAMKDFQGLKNSEKRSKFKQLKKTLQAICER